MSKYYLTHKSEKCVACQACEVQCKTHHGLPQGPNLCQIERLQPESSNDPLNQGFVFMPGRLPDRCDSPAGKGRYRSHRAGTVYWL